MVPPGHGMTHPSGVLRVSAQPVNRVPVLLALGTALLLAACGSPTATPGATSSSPSPSPAVASSSAGSAAPSVPSSSPDPTGFAFAADDIAAYYVTQGYVCAAPQPSATSANFLFRTCQLVDDAGRTRIIGLVTDPDGGLANAFASVKGTDSEPILAPIDALDPLAGFLGATLGEERGAALLTWLAAHLGDAYAQTTSGPIKVATYTPSEDDHSTLFVEVANRAYLDAPPVGSPVASPVTPP
jgi:hypothetical protein